MILAWKLCSIAFPPSFPRRRGSVLLTNKLYFGITGKTWIPAYAGMRWVVVNCSFLKINATEKILFTKSSARKAAIY